VKHSGNPAKKAAARLGAFRTVMQSAAEHYIAFAAALFILSFAVRLFLSFRTGPVLAVVFPDEIRYLHIAKSIAECGRIMVRGAPTVFQKILYPVFLSPAFLLASDPMRQTVVIRVINCLLMSSAIFPVALLGKKITSSKAALTVSMLAVCTLPDIAYSATLASEVLYLPVVCWMFYAGYVAMSASGLKRRLISYGVFGFAIYLAYLTKEVAAGFLIAAVLMLVLDSIRDKSGTKQNGTKQSGTKQNGTKPIRIEQSGIKQNGTKQNALAALALLAAFFAAHLFVKTALFPGVGNSYGAASGFDQLTLSEISSMYDLFYLVYGAGLLLVAAIMSCYALPVLLSLYGYDAMGAGKRKLFLFALSSLVIMIGAYAYTVLIREELGSFVPRLSLRYFSPVVVPFLILCFDFLLQGGAAPCADKPAPPPLADEPKKNRDSSQTLLPGRAGVGAVKTGGAKTGGAKTGGAAPGADKPANPPLADEPKKKRDLISRAFPYIIVIFCTVVLVLMPSGPERDVPIDHFTLKSTMPLQGLHFTLAPGELFRGPGEMRFNALWTLFKALLILLTASGAWFAAKGKRGRALIFLLVFIFSVNAYDNTLSYLGIRYEKLYDFTDAGFEPHRNAGLEAYKNYTAESFSANGMDASYGFVNSLISVNENIRNLDGDVLVFINAGASSFVDTYLDQKAFHANYDFLLDLADFSGGSIDVAAQPIEDSGNTHVTNSQMRSITQFDYIIVLDSDNPFENTDTVFAREPFLLLRNLEPAKLHMDISGYTKVPRK